MEIMLKCACLESARARSREREIKQREKRQNKREEREGEREREREIYIYVSNRETFAFQASLSLNVKRSIQELSNRNCLNLGSLTILQTEVPYLRGGGRGPFASGAFYLDSI